ncbi:MAG TPA: phosphatidate cytidylyltransferase [Verrucomicrobiae bacterium]|nr:phosphatidate cytidylyltransferase [Verrucomicrobiae bacterium]
MTLDNESKALIAAVASVLAISSIIGWILSKKDGDEKFKSTIKNLNDRVRAWWIIASVFLFAVFGGNTTAIVVFGFISFLGLREFITITPTRRGDHRTLFWTFFIITPIHYWLVHENRYGFFTIFIPVYAFLFIPLRSAIAGDCERFLERAAKIQWALMVCVYALSHAPALLYLKIPGYIGENAKLLFFFVAVAQSSDVLQYIFGKLFGWHKIAPKLSPNKTIEGFLGGILSASAIGAAAHSITPFTAVQAAGMSFVITVLGFAGGLVMSAIKRDRGIKDYGATLAGHGGIMDRIDSLCFSAPVFFHLTRFYFTE